jgi:hypothetical protein
MSESFSFVQLSRLYWVGPITVLVSIAAVLVVRIVAVALLHPPSDVRTALSGPSYYRYGHSCQRCGVCLYDSGDDGTNPIRTFRIIAALVLLFSFIPDILIVRSHAFGATWPYAFALMTMHVTAWAVCVTMLTKLPVVSARQP